LNIILVIKIILLGIVAGGFAGMFGIGGGIAILPVLMLIFSWNVYVAVGTSLAALLLPTNIIALNNYRKKGFLYIKGSLLVAFGMVCGNYLGALLALNINGILVKILFGIYMIIIGIKYVKPVYMFNKLFRHEVKEDLEPIYTKIEQVKNYIFLLGGIGGGALAGMFGIGGGLLITTILISTYNINPKQAVAISLGAMFLPVGITGTMLYYNNGYVNILAAILIAIGIEIGSNISSRIALNIEQGIFKQIFGVFLFLLGLYFIFEKLII
jgi:uncharacterized membrane protein YfcA